jgi:hypothetical protein
MIKAVFGKYPAAIKPAAIGLVGKCDISRQRSKYLKQQEFQGGRGNFRAAHYADGTAGNGAFGRRELT